MMSEQAPSGIIDPNILCRHHLLTVRMLFPEHLQAFSSLKPVATFDLLLPRVKEEHAAALLSTARRGIPVSQQTLETTVLILSVLVRTAVDLIVGQILQRDTDLIPAAVGI